MPNILFMQPDGSTRAVDIPVGYSLMEGAVRNDIPGIVGECGGVCSCATCHVYIDPAWIDRVAPLAEPEATMLDFAVARKAGSRLSCQIRMSETLDNLVVHVAESQY